MADSSVKARPATFTLTGESRTYHIKVATADALKDGNGVWFRPTTASVTITDDTVTAVEFTGLVIAPATKTKPARTTKWGTSRYYGPKELAATTGQSKLLADVKAYALARTTGEYSPSWTAGFNTAMSVAYASEQVGCGNRITREQWDLLVEHAPDVVEDTTFDKVS